MLRVYNTKTRKKEEFKSIEQDLVKMYSCGPTVYSNAHIGNMRAYIFMDNLRKVLKYNGYNVLGVMNITDVGHMTSDEDEGEDKMELAAKKTGKSPREIADEYTKYFIEDIKKLHIELPEIVAKATDNIKEMEAYVTKIFENGYAYETSKGVYFDTSKLSDYGSLSRAKLEDNKAGARIEVDNEKRNPRDFALWIKAPKNHIMKWNSRWGTCYPGWHIECSAMSTKFLGEVFDIHTGGVDHIPVHHENEIAQSKGATSKDPANYWMHVEFLQVNGGKMSKSLGNVYTISSLQEKGYLPLAYRYFTYSSHYRNKLNFTFEGLDAAKVSLKRLKENASIHLASKNEKIDEKILNKYRIKFLEAINDDLNLPVALSIAWEVAKNQEKSVCYANLLKEFDTVLSLRLFDENKAIVDNSEVEKLLEKRREAREIKNYALSDELRDTIKEMGYIVKDTKSGQELEKIKE